MNNSVPARETALSLHDVGVYYFRRINQLQRQPFWVFQNMTFDLYRGETLGVIGRNGAGKSTLLRVLAGILKPDIGTMENRGYNATLLSLQVGFMPQLTGRKNIILSGLLLGMTRREIDDKMDAIITFADVGDFIDEQVRKYSSGMKARLGFAVAYYADPDIILLDEVLGVGDMTFREKSTEAMKEKIRSNHTVVLVSHQPQTVRELCDRLLWIEHGVIRKLGPTEEVFSEYKEYFRQQKAG